MTYQNVNIWQQNYTEELLDEKYIDRIFLLKLIWNAFHVLENCSIHIPETTITSIESIYQIDIHVYREHHVLHMIHM